MYLMQYQYDNTAIFINRLFVYKVFIQNCAYAITIFIWDKFSNQKYFAVVVRDTE